MGVVVDTLTQHWSLDPFLAVTLAIALLHERGIRHLAARSTSDRGPARRRQSLLFYAGLAVLDLTVVSPIDYYAGLYFWVHVVQHLLLMFAAPVLLVAGAPWLPLAHGLSVGVRRTLGRALLLSSWAAPLRATGRFLSRPWTAIIAFNLAMVFWHIPGPFDLAYRNEAVHVWLMHGSFFVVGVFFWLQFIGSYPLRPRLTPLTQAGALFGTNVVMFLLAVAVGMMATGSWYSVYDHVPGVTMSPLADQQLGSGILWVCGDFWCFPALYRAVRKWIDDDESRALDQGLDRLLRGAL
jgi:cytochrome c oxidase assembly factor CtaG